MCRYAGIDWASAKHDVFVADDKVADIQVRSSTQLYVFGKGRPANEDSEACCQCPVRLYPCP